jgi:hypothetical protein
MSGAREIFTESQISGSTFAGYLSRIYTILDSDYSNVILEMLYRKITRFAIWTVRKVC